MVVSKRNLEVNLIESGVTNVVFRGLEAQPSRLDRARVADNHVEQDDPILFARNTIGPALEFFVTMLTDWINDAHDFRNQQTTCLHLSRFSRSEIDLSVADLGLIARMCVECDTGAVSA